MAVEHKKVPVLQEGFQLDFVKGVISKNDDGQWVFRSDERMFDGSQTVKAQSPIEMLPSSMLEKLTADINGKNGKEVKRLDVRLQANVTKYQGKNYLYATSYIPISQSKKVPEAEAAKKADRLKQVEKNVEGDSILSSEIKNLLKPDWSPDLAQKKKRDNVDVADDYSMPSRTGFFIVKDGVKYFQLDSLGRKIDRNAYRLLPCSAFGAAERARYTMPGRKRYVISGTVTVYKGQKYLLAQRIVRTYNHGNFAR
jgi:hypothetical protein